MVSRVTGQTSVQSLSSRSTCLGGIDLAGIFPLYINIRRGAIITVAFAWVCQPWQLVNRPSTFIYVISSFSIFLAPIMGVMVVDFYLVRKMRLKLSELYKPHGDFWYSGGVNWRAFPAWIVGWAPTIGGLILESTPETSGPRVLSELYFVAFFYGAPSEVYRFPKPADICAQVFSLACWFSTSQTWYSQSPMSEIWMA